MPVIEDFTLVGQTTVYGGGTATVNYVQPGDFIVAVSHTSRHQEQGLPALHFPSGIDVALLYEGHTTPFDFELIREGTPRAFAGWASYLTGYHIGFEWSGITYWYYEWWKYMNYMFSAKLSLYRALSAGSVTVEFAKPTEDAYVWEGNLAVWRPSYTVPSGRIVRSIHCTFSAREPKRDDATLSVPAEVGDIIVALGSGAFILNDNVTISGVTLQQLLNYNRRYGAYYVFAGLWLAKTNGNVSLTFTGYNLSRTVLKLIPFLELANNTIPQIPEPGGGGEGGGEWDEPIIQELAYFYTEFAADLLPNGRVLRPKWFEDIREQYSWSSTLGLRKRWIKGTTLTNIPPRTKLVELWKVPVGAQTLIPAGEALIFTSDQEAESRVLFHDKGW